MPDSTPTVLVVGATGNVGSPLVARLLDRGDRAATRQPDAYRGPDGAMPVRFDLDDFATGYGALGDADDIAAVAAEVRLGIRHESAAYAVTGPEALESHEAAAGSTAAAGREIRYPPVLGDALRP